MNNESDAGGDKLYRTSDIYFAAYLCSLDFILEATENSRSDSDNSRKMVFVFKVTDEHIKRAKTSFFAGTGTVKARKFVDNIRSLKQMCFT